MTWQPPSDGPPGGPDGPDGPDGGPTPSLRALAGPPAAADGGGGGGGPGGGPDCFYNSVCAPDEFGDYDGRHVELKGINYCVYFPNGSGSAPPPYAIVRYQSFNYPDPSSDDMTCLVNRIARDRADDSTGMYAITAAELRDLSPHAQLQRDEQELLAWARTQGVPRLVFDLRENGGGDFDPPFFANFTDASYSIPIKRFVYGTAFQANPALVLQGNLFLLGPDGNGIEGTESRVQQALLLNRNATLSDPFPFYCQTNKCPASEATLTPSCVPTKGKKLKATLLVGPTCFSSCDDFTSIMVDNGNATSIGMSTGAGDSPFNSDMQLPMAFGVPPVTFHLTTGISYHPKSSSLVMEAHPAPVAKVVRPSAANRANYLDALLAQVPTD
jgi:hypothetical protein